MRIFKKPNTGNNWKCLICNTNEEKEIVLIGKANTVKDRIAEAEQIHLACIELLLYERDSGEKCIAQLIRKAKQK